MQESTLEEMFAIRQEPLPLDNKLRRFLGRLPANAQFTIAISGKPGGGKSTFVLHYLVPQLRRSGTVLYFTTEEDLNQGTITERAVRGKVTHSDNLMFAASDNMDDLRAKILKDSPRFCIIDSVNEFRDADGREVLPKTINLLEKEFPAVSFVFIAQMEATLRRFAGGAKMPYRGDVVVRCEQRADGAQVAYLEKFRYGSVDTEFIISPPQNKKKPAKPDVKKKRLQGSPW